MNAQLLEFTIILAYAIILGAFSAAVMANINYRISLAYLEITLLGITVRRIRLDDIRAISTKRVFWAECWPNTLLARDRHLLIQRNSGWLKNLVISPPYRFVFRSELAEAKRVFAASLADRPVFKLPRPSIVQQLYSRLKGQAS